MKASKKPAKRFGPRTRLGKNGKKQCYVATWIDEDEFLKIGLDAIDNNRSMSGELRNRIIKPK